MELQLLVRWFEQALPFIFLLLLVFIYQHRKGIIIFALLQLIFLRNNAVIKKQVSLKENRKISVSLCVVLILMTQIFSVYFLFRNEELWKYLILMPSMSLRILTVWDVLWIVVINDIQVRFASMIIKSLFLILIGASPPHKRKGQVYSIIEITVTIYRTILPVPVWCIYFGDEGNGHIFSSFITGLYLTFKFTTLWDQFRKWFSTVKSFILKEGQYGKYATVEEVREAGDICSICQEPMRTPIKLECAHVYCEDCVSEWFEREKTCPLCRSVIKTAGNRTHADGSTSIMVQIF